MTDHDDPRASLYFALQQGRYSPPATEKMRETLRCLRGLGQLGPAPYPAEAASVAHLR